LQVNKTDAIKQRLVELWKSSNACTFELKDVYFSVLPGTAKALLGEVEKLIYNLTVCCLGNIPVKNYQNQLMYVEVIAMQSSVF